MDNGEKVITVSEKSYSIVEKNLEFLEGFSKVLNFCCCTNGTGGMEEMLLEGLHSLACEVESKACEIQDILGLS